MPNPVRIQRRRTRGYRLPAGAISVTRPGPFGNPFNFRPPDFCWLALSYGCRGDLSGRMEASVRAYRDWLTAPEGQVVGEYERKIVVQFGRKAIDIGAGIKVGRAPTRDEIRAALRGHDLACWCPITLPDGSRYPCHADVLLEIANA